MLLQKKDNRNWVFWLTLFVLFCLGVYALKSVLLPFVAGIIIGYLLDPGPTALSATALTARWQRFWFFCWLLSLWSRL